MDNETEVIRHQMEETREALQEKLEKLEHEVKDTVTGATEAVHSVTEAVQQTVSTVKGTVQETVETVKESVAETVETVKETFDIQRQVCEHPWLMMAGAVGVGFVGGRLLLRASSSAPASASALAASAPTFGNGAGFAARETAPAVSTSPKRGWWGFITDHYSQELNQLKGLAVAAVGGVIRDALVSSVPPTLADRVREVVDGLTAKMGGQPIPGPVLSGSHAAPVCPEPHGGPWDPDRRSEPAGARAGQGI
jgi:ElaB/YqjD/DUF883 family membrane-anchored ribosome-binding protein